MKFDHIEYAICDYFLPALINDDYTGFDDDGEAAIREWLEEVPINGHWDVVENSDNFRHCDITGLYGDTVIVRRYFQSEG
jgi:hypothetical protein